MKRTIGLVLLGLSFGSVGCETTRPNTAAGAGIGTAIGAGTGGLIGRAGGDQKPPPLRTATPG